MTQWMQLATYFDECGRKSGALQAAENRLATDNHRGAVNHPGHPKRTFGVRELGPAFSTADSSAVCFSPRPVAVDDAPRRVAASKSGDESPHSESFARANRQFGSWHTVLGRNAL